MLGVGFALVILLLVSAAVVGVESARSIQKNAANLVAEQFLTSRLIDEIQQEEETLTAVFRTLAAAPDSVDRAKIEAQLEESSRRIEHAVGAGVRTTEEPLWNELRRASAAFTAEARRLLANPSGSLSSEELFHRHDEVIAVVARLINASYQKGAAAQAQIENGSRELQYKSALLLGSGLAVALLCVLLTLRTTAGMLRKMEWQAGELNRVSWHMLENQESAARRFSHELHDELGQSLTAIKANLAALAADPSQAASRLEDCGRLVDDAIRNVRELSQLLRPTILDDFGLDASLRWLGEGFTQRTGIEVEYDSNFSGRLSDETETHLFRIAQEALTNVARHSGANRVRMNLQADERAIRLSIADNGRGLVNGASAAGMGMTGMRARAREAGGEFRLREANGSGVAIDVEVPARR